MTIDTHHHMLPDSFWQVVLFRIVWSLSNAFTSAFKKLDLVPQFKATAKLGEFHSHLPA